MDISKVLDINRINLNSNATSKEEVIREVVDILDSAGVLEDKNEFIKDVYLREAEGVTGMGNGLCIPHGKSETVKKTSIAILRTNDDVEWESLDDKPIRLVIMMAIKESDKSELVSILSQVAVKLCDDSLVEILFNTNEPKDVIDVFVNEKED